MQELMSFRNWVVTYPHDKVPLNPYTMRRADVSDHATWADYATANGVVCSNKGLILGFVLTNSPFSCVDLDTYRTRDAAIIEYHRQLYEAFNTYSELSPQEGVHLWMQGKLSGVDGKKLPKAFVEMYSSSRYITITRRSLNNHRIENRQDKLEALYQSAIDPMFSSNGNGNGHVSNGHVLNGYSNGHVSNVIERSDAEVCTAAANAINGELFKELWMGHWQDKYPSQSEADQAFVNIVAYYTESMEQVARIFRASQLGKRQKAFRTDYLYNVHYGIVVRAFDQKLPNIHFKEIEDAVKNHVDEERLKAMQTPINGFVGPALPTEPEIPKAAKKLVELPEFVKTEFNPDFKDFPPGLTGEIARFIYRNSVRPVKEIAIAGAIALMAGICGRLYNVSEMGLNHYIAILAPTGTGKEGASSGIESLVGYCKETVENVELFLGPHEIASPQALLRHLSTVSACCVSRHEEMGIWINKICNKRANDNNAGLRGMLLALYTSSGKGKVYRETIRADAKKDTPTVYMPAFSLYGDSTPDKFYEALDEDQLDQGLVSRFMVIECEPEADCMFNEMHGKIKPDPNLIVKLSGLMQRCLRYILGDKEHSKGDVIFHVDCTAEAKLYMDQFRLDCDAKVLNDAKSADSIVYSRGYERLLRLAALVSVGINPDVPIITYEVAQWAKKLIVRTMACVILRFERGEVGEANLYIAQRQAMISMLRNYIHGGYTDEMMKRYNINQEMYYAKIVTNNYLNTKMRSYAAFRRARNTSLDFNNALNDLIKNGVLLRFDMGRVRESFRQGIAYYINDMTLLQD